MIKNIVLAFIPIFVAVDALGVLPIFVSFTQGCSQKEQLKVIYHSIQTAAIIAIVFIFVGKWIFSVLGITVGDFMVAGGAILFCISISDILNPTKKSHISTRDFGFVPLGTPLIVGPAVLTTSLILISEYGLIATLISVILNVLLAGALFLLSTPVIKLMGESGARAISKVTSLLLGGIAVMMIRKGLHLIFLLFK